MSSNPMVQVSIGGRDYDGDLDVSMSFPIQESNVPAFEKKLGEWSKKMGPGGSLDE